MFDSITIRPSRTEHVPYCREVKEFRAPTDASVKLLMEMEQEAQKKFVKGFVIKDTVVDGVVCQFSTNNVFRTRIWVHFILNGEDFHCEHVIEAETITPQKMIDVFCEDISKQITRKLTQRLLDEYRRLQCSLSA